MADVTMAADVDVEARATVEDALDAVDEVTPQLARPGPPSRRRRVAACRRDQAQRRLPPAYQGLHGRRLPRRLFRARQR